MYKLELFDRAADLVEFMNVKNLERTQIIVIEYQNNSEDWVLIYSEWI